MQCVDTASGRERKCLDGGLRSRSVSTNQPSSEETLRCWNTSQEEDTAPVRFPQGPMSDQRSLGRQGGNESSRLVQLRRCRWLALDQVFETGRVGWLGPKAGSVRQLDGPAHFYPPLASSYRSLGPWKRRQRPQRASPIMQVVFATYCYWMRTIISFLRFALLKPCMSNLEGREV